MKKYILFLVILTSVLWVLGSNFVQAAPLTVHPSNPRYFTDGSGKAILLVGSHDYYSLQGNDSDHNFTDYLAFLNTKGHNFMRGWMWEHSWVETWDPELLELMVYQRTGPGYANDGGLKFDVSQFNQAYFDRIRARAIAAGNAGIYVSIMFFQGFSLHPPDWPSWVDHYFNAANNINGINGDPNGDGNGKEVHTLAISAITVLQEAYIKKVIDTLNDLDNIIWEISNESPSATIGGEAWTEYMIDKIRTYENGKAKQHLVGFTTLWPDYTNAKLFASTADWISPNHGTSGTEYQDNMPASDGTKIVITDTDHLWGLGGSDIWAWKSFTRGLHPIFMEYPKYTDGNGWKEDLRLSLGHILVYANKMGLVNMTPQNSLSSTAYCLANQGVEYLVYQPGSGSFTVNLQAGIYSYEWFNPTSGSVAGTGSITVSAGSRSFTPPFSGDAVLYLKITSSAPDPVPLPAGNWVKVADEGGICNFSGTMEVWYGASDKYFYKTVPGGTACSNSVFGDPLVGVAKACYVREELLPQQNPIAHYKLDETSGTIASDSSGNGNTGTLVNGPFWTTGKIGNALSFDGTNDYVTVNDSSVFDIGTGNMTISVWVKRSTNTTFDGPISHTNGSSASDGWWVDIFSDTGEANDNAVLFCMDDTDHIGSADLIPVGAWTHIIIVKSGTAISFYINGTFDKTVDYGKNINNSAGNLRIGLEGSFYGTNYFGGLIDDARIYNRALSASEIQTLYNAGTDTTPPSAPTGVMVN